MSLATGTEIVMPRLSDSMEEGTILSWLAAPGAAVAVNDDLLEIETDKANMTVQAEASGVLEILAEEGSTLAVGTPIARLLSGERLGSPAEPTPGPETAPAAPPGPADPTGPATPSLPAASAPSDGAARATPLARRIARDHGIELASLAGSGAGGRITKADVKAAAGVSPEPPPVPRPATPTVEASSSAKGEAELREPSRLQAVIARRMAESKGVVPHFQVETEVRMDAAIAFRAELKRAAGEASAPSVNDLIVKAVALALRSHPKANASYRDGMFELHRRINVGIAVATAEALVVPTIHDADQKSLGEISRTSRSLAERVRANEVTPPELAGGTFTVSNLGMFGMTAIYPVINLPQAAILGVGATRPRLVRGEEDEVEDASFMTLTLSCDHRILYGAESAQFLAAVRDLLETPLQLAL